MSSNNLSPSIRNLTAVDIFLFTKISIHLLEGFITGKFKPNSQDREKLSDLSRRFYRRSENQIRAYVDRKKYREVRPFLSTAEKDNLFSQKTEELYSRTLDKLVKQHFDQIVLALAEK